MGAFGLFLLSALDSSFLFLPFGNDVLLIALVSSERTGPTWILYVLVSAVGSLVGVFLIDLIMRKTGEKGLERFIGPKRLEKLRDKMENKAGITVFVSTLMPPPFPFTPVVMTASALQCPRLKLFGAVFAGRLIRFTVEALLALYFGRRVIRYINSEWFAYFIYVLMAIALIGSAFSALKWLSQKRQLA
ncbi:MAG TPA: VTT domain-containing protein [Pyrinomonadaceae bacterium]|nr:VTT domain-containing protein [Pyrinomonadaceae bacterium]